MGKLWQIGWVFHVGQQPASARIRGDKQAGVAANYIFHITPPGRRLPMSMLSMESDFLCCPVIRRKCSASSASLCFLCFSLVLVPRIPSTSWDIWVVFSGGVSVIDQCGSERNPGGGRAS